MVYQIKYVLGLLLLVAVLQNMAVAGDITQVWLTHGTNDPNKIVVNWVTDEPGDSVVEFGLSADYGQKVRIEEHVTLHHVEIPLQHQDAVYHYSVASGDSRSVDATFKTHPTDVFRVAVVADWQDKPDLSAIVKDDFHLLLSAGDHIARLWQKCGEGTKDCVKPYLDLVESYPELFSSTPFMPALGNHDREIRPRGKRYPAVASYDVDATAFRRFFALPGDEWKWRFDLPEFDLCFIALDLNHTSDCGTTWQTCHSFDEKSQQFRWYKKQAEKLPSFAVTLFNEKSSTVRNLAGGRWGELLGKGTCCITGYGYFAERAEVDGVPYYNTALNGRKNKYPDPNSTFFESKDNYILLTVQRKTGKMVIEIKSLEGKVLDRREWNR